PPLHTTLRAGRKCRVLFSRLLLSSPDQESIDGRLLVTFAWFKDRRRESRLVRRVRKVLGLETKPTTKVVNPAGLTSDFIEKVSGIKLHARLGGPHVQH